MNVLDEIAVEAKRVAQLRTWVREGLQKLLTKMNEKVAEITSDQPPVRGLLTKSTDEYGIQINYYLAINFEGDAYFEVEVGREYGDETVYYPTRVDALSPKRIREIALNIPQALQDILGQLAGINNGLDETIKILEGMIEKLS